MIAAPKGGTVLPGPQARESWQAGGLRLRACLFSPLPCTRTLFLLSEPSSFRRREQWFLSSGGGPGSVISPDNVLVLKGDRACPLDCKKPKSGDRACFLRKKGKKEGKDGRMEGEGKKEEGREGEEE